MTCRDFSDLWNRRLDAPASFEATLLAAIEAHQASCAPCRRLGAAYALLAASPAPAAPDGMADRILAAWGARGRVADPRAAMGGWRRAWVPLAGLAAAAAVVLAALSARTADRPRPAATPRLAAAPPARPWTAALAEATTATLDLARETSAPVARIGQDVILASRSSASPEPGPDRPPGAGARVVDAVSRRVNAGMRPLSGTARRAFSFLNVPSPTPRDRPPGKSGA